MARQPGNHGIVIPRDRALLHRLYWEQNHTLPEIGAMFDVTHKSVERVFRKLDIPRRKLGPRICASCKDCGSPEIVRVKHAGNGAFYGRRCKECRRKHFARLAREEGKRPEVKQRIRRSNQRSYYEGPIEPKGESQWISKSKVLLRNVRRLTMNPGASPFPNAGSKPARTSRG